MSDDVLFIDSNVWLYSMFVSPAKDKKQKADEIIDGCDPLISYQVIQEILANLRKKQNATPEKLDQIVLGLEEDCTIIR